MGSWIEAGHQKDQAIIRNLELSMSCHLLFSGEERGPGELTIDCLPIMKLLEKNPRTMGFEESLG
jgi:hypothetical protein